MDESDIPRPAEIALLLLASGDLLPRQRARDQQADLTGNNLKSHVLNAIVHADPEPEALELALEQIIAEVGPPTGPTRGVALSFLEDWQAARVSPAFVEWLLSQAVREGMEPTGGRRRGRKNRPDPGAEEQGNA